jgi:hypothetical protein
MHLTWLVFVVKERLRGGWGEVGKKVRNRDTGSEVDHSSGHIVVRKDGTMQQAKSKPNR